MKTIQLLAISTVFLLLANATRAQQGNVSMKLNYSVAVPAGSFKEFVSNTSFLGEFSDSKTSFGFAAVPEAGLFVPFRKQSSAGFNIGAAYNIMPYNYGDVKNLNSLGIKAGVSFMLH